MMLGHSLGFQSAICMSTVSFMEHKEVRTHTVWPWAARLTTSRIHITSPAAIFPLSLLGRVMLSKISLGEYSDIVGEDDRLCAAPPADSRSPGILG